MSIVIILITLAAGVFALSEGIRAALRAPNRWWALGEIVGSLLAAAFFIGVAAIITDRNMRDEVVYISEQGD